MASLNEEIVEWANSRPTWQRHILARLAAGQKLEESHYREIASKLSQQGNFPTKRLNLADTLGSRDSANQVSFLEIAEVSNVNALTLGQNLTFAGNGITVVYGDNGSGKSGYARLLKQIAGARDREEVLTDIFTDHGDSKPQAHITVSVGNARQTPFVWPEETLSEVRQIRFYDESCGSAYLTTESEVTYRPTALFLLDGLVKACDAVRSELDKLLRETNAQVRALPHLPEQGPAAAFLDNLSATTSMSEIDQVCQVAEDTETVIAELLEEEARLRASDPPEERRRTFDLAKRYELLANRLALLDRKVGPLAVRDATQRIREARESRRSVERAMTAAHRDNPLSGVGSPRWRSLWEAARDYSNVEAYPDQQFPCTSSESRCVLCHQDLDAEARSRLDRFESSIQDMSEYRAQRAEQEADNLLASMKSMTQTPTEIEVALELLTPEQSHLMSQYRAKLGAYEDAVDSLVNGVGTDANEEDHRDHLESQLRSFASKLRESADRMDADEYSKQLDELSQRRLDLQDRLLLSGARVTIEEEIERLKLRAEIEVAKRQTDTMTITRNAAELTRAHVTTVVRDRFTRESERLNVDRVTLKDTGGHKGRLHHKPTFVGAVQDVPMPKVLSEGEQTALGLAGFFTEAYLDESLSAIVLDDPVSSLDHIRRGHVASRLADLATRRQVIVFTHDIAFVSELRRASTEKEVDFTERSVERHHIRGPGECHDVHPWKAKDIKTRLGDLRSTLDQIRRDCDEWSQEEYEKETSEWAGKLSETWERMVRQEIVDYIFDQSTQEIRPKMVRLLGHITEADNREFQDSYSHVSRWSRRHDKSPELNYVAPSIDEMRTELDLVKAWFTRIKEYRT